MFYRNTRVLVTGGTGFVGCHIVQKLLQEGARVVIPVHNRNLPVAVDDGRCELIHADLFAPNDCFTVTKGVDYVFHAAGGVVGAGVGHLSQIELIRKNLVLTSQILEASWKNNVQRALIFSSSTVYPVLDHPVQENEAWTGEVDAAYLGYGWMRRYFEKLAEFVHRHSPVRVAIVRPAAVYGRFDNFDESSSHVIPSLIRKAVEKKGPFVVWGTGEEQRDFLHVSDLAAGCLLMLERYAAADPVNIGYGQSVTIRETVRMILHAAEYRDAEVIFDQSKPATIPKRLVDTSKSDKFLNFHPTTRLEDGIADTVAWYQSLQESREA